MAYKVKDGLLNLTPPTIGEIQCLEVLFMEVIFVIAWGSHDKLHSFSIIK